uniref:MMS19 nucleotide excision repair protein n=1 Tax=Parastrongyloides trichosuri TaxID=131310 RepID=A0A0N4Z213_PARTI
MMNKNEIYKVNVVIAKLYSEMIIKLSENFNYREGWDTVIKGLLTSLIDNIDLRERCVKDYDIITHISKVIPKYNGDDYESVVGLENQLKVLQVLSIDGFIVSDCTVIEEMMPLMIRSLTTKGNDNLKKLSSRIITNICCTYPSYASIVRESPSYKNGKRCLFEDVFKIPSLMTSYISFVNKFDSAVKETLNVNENLFKILLFNFNTLKMDCEPTLRLYVCRFIESLIFDDNDEITELGVKWKTEKYSKPCIKEIFKLIPTISKNSEDLGVLYQFLYKLTLNDDILKLIYDILIEQTSSTSESIFKSYTLLKCFKVASFEDREKIPVETTISAGYFFTSILGESIRREYIWSSDSTGVQDIIDYIEKLSTSDKKILSKKIITQQIVLYFKLLSTISKDMFLVTYIERLVTGRQINEMMDISFKDIALIKSFLRNGVSLDENVKNSIRIIPTIICGLNKIKENLNHLNFESIIYNRESLHEILSAAFLSRDKKLVKDALCCMRYNIPKSCEDKMANCIKGFNKSDNLLIPLTSNSHAALKQAKEALEISDGYLEAERAMVQKLKDEIETLRKDDNEKVTILQEENRQLKEKLEQLVVENGELKTFKESIKKML